jgi:hypothetical protein
LYHVVLHAQHFPSFAAMVETAFWPLRVALNPSQSEYFPSLSLSQLIYPVGGDWLRFWFLQGCYAQHYA